MAWTIHQFVDECICHAVVHDVWEFIIPHHHMLLCVCLIRYAAFLTPMFNLHTTDLAACGGLSFYHDMILSYSAD